ncbi:MAG: DMT family transporter [Acidobacteria bacterium]|nr:DMT family transporter [Acidobacteriota bacterium]
MDRQRLGTLEMSGAMTVSGTIGWFVLSSGESVLRVVLWRCIFGALTLFLACAAMGLLHHLRNKRVLLLGSLGGVMIVLNWLLLFSAYSRSSISIATAIYNTYPFMLFVLGAIFFAEKMTASKLLWLIAAFAGVLLIVMADTKVGGFGSHYLAGVAMALGAALCYAVCTILIKKLSGTPPHIIALIQVVVGMILMGPITHAAPSTSKGWGMVATIGIVHTGLVYILLYGAIQKLPTHLTAALSFIYPAVAILVDIIALGRRLHPMQIAGAGIIFLAVAGMTFGWSLKRSAPQPALSGCD